MKIIIKRKRILKIKAFTKQINKVKKAKCQKVPKYFTKKFFFFMSFQSLAKSCKTFLILQFSLLRIKLEFTSPSNFILIVQHLRTRRLELLLSLPSQDRFPVLTNIGLLKKCATVTNALAYCRWWAIRKISFTGFISVWNTFLQRSLEKRQKFLLLQGTLTEQEGSVRLTSSLRELVL